MRTVSLGIVGSLVLLAACGGDPVAITYRADSSNGADVEVTYDGDDGEVTEVVASPWELTVEFSGDYSASLTVRNLELSGDVFCEIAGEDLPPIITGGEAAALCSVSVRSEGGGTSISTSTDFELFVRDADGNPVPPPPEPIRLPGADLGRAVSFGDDLLLGSHQAIWVLDLETATVEDVRRFSQPTDPTRLDDGTLVATSYFDGTVEALTPGAEEVAILAEYPDERPAAVWAVDGELLVTLGEPDEFVRLGLDGSERWRVATPGEVIDLVELDGVVIAATNDRDADRLIVIDPADGTVIGSLPTAPDPVGVLLSEQFLLVHHRGDIVSRFPLDAVRSGAASDPVVEDGRRYVVGSDGTVYRLQGLTLTRLDPVTGEDGPSIEVGDRRPFAASADNLYLLDTDGSDPEIVVLPLTLFG